MECAFCGIEFSDKPYRRDGRIYCSRDCAEAHTEEIYGDDDTGYNDSYSEDYDEELEQEY
jgi:hypothetical protein